MFDYQEETGIFRGHWKLAVTDAIDTVCSNLASQVVLVVKDLPANAGDVRDVGSILGSGRSAGGGNGNPLQYSCLENPMDRGTWWVTVHGVTKSWTRLKRFRKY